MKDLTKYRFALLLFVIGLLLSGVTAFPLATEVDLLVAFLRITQESTSPLTQWLLTVQEGIHDTGTRYPWIFYGTDWLAFGHIVIAMFFVGPWINPVSNRWVLKVGLVACAGVIPIALVCGSLRSIPGFWRCVDCLFGIIGALPLVYCLRISERMRDQHIN